MIRHTLFMPLALLLAACIFLTSACKKTEDDNSSNNSSTTLTEKRVTNLDANGIGGHFAFYSLKDGSAVALADSATTKWDIGFRKTAIIVNAGTSGSGMGGAQVFSGIFSDVATAPTTGYNVDATTSYAIPTGSGNGWYTYANMIISPTAGKVLLIKTADGKYAKAEILSYYKDAPATPDANSVGRFYTFRYIYQPDGSTKLK